MESASVELGEKIEARLNALVETLANDALEKLKAPENEEALVIRIMETEVFRKAVYERNEARLATEIGNRLRCGIYNALEMDALFERVWVKELDKALEDRVRQKIDKYVSTEVKTRIQALLKHL
jgi:hypothetical protein